MSDSLGGQMFLQIVLSTQDHYIVNDTVLLTSKNGYITMRGWAGLASSGLGAGWVVDSNVA